MSDINTETLKLAILRTLSSARHQHKFNLLGRGGERGDLERQLGLSFDIQQRHFAATVFDELAEQGLIQPTYQDLIDPASWFAITDGGREALSGGVVGTRTDRRAASPELEQKFGILFSAGQAVKDFANWCGADALDSLALLFLDIDNFKPLNTRLTETVVDKSVLPEFQQLLSLAVKHRGKAYRQGGEEFIIALPNHSKAEAALFAEKVRTQIEAHVFRSEAQEVRITISIGVSSFPDDGTEYSQVLQAANSAEHAAKTLGRNRVSIAGVTSQPSANRATETTLTTDRKRLQLVDLFRTEYEKTIRSTVDAIIRVGGIETPIKQQAYFDCDGRSKFVGYFISKSPNTYELCQILASQPEETFKALEGEMEISAGFVGQREKRSTADLQFVRQVLIYHEEDLTPRQAVDLDDFYKRQGLSLVLRGPEYLSIKSTLLAVAKSLIR